MLSLILRNGAKELKSSVSLMQRRNFIFRVKTSEKKYRRKDKIDDSFSIIYKAPMEYYLATCNHVTTASALAIGAFIAYKYVNRFEEVSTELKELEFTGGIIGVSDDELIYFAAGLVVICLSVRMILYKYPLRIYRNQANKYIAIFEGYFPMTKTRMNFEKGSVKEMPPAGIMPWRDHRYMIKDRSTILYFEYFKTPSELINMMKAPTKQQTK